MRELACFGASCHSDDGVTGSMMGSVVEGRSWSTHMGPALLLGRSDIEKASGAAG